jgi:phosphatidylglycerophosphatase A
MKDQKIRLLNKLNYIFLSFFGSGYSPFAPGTMGSLATIPFIYALSYFDITLIQLIVLTIIIFIPACIIAQKIQVRDKVHDPGWIVIDEVIGMLITWCFVFPKVDIYSISYVFIAFRFFDIFKIWPASYFDKKMTHGFATIFDDVISAVYAGLFILLVQYILGII